MRPRHALTLLALALPLPVVLTGLPQASSTTGAAPEPFLDRSLVLEHETALPDAPRPRQPRLAPRRATRSTHRVALHRHVTRPTPTTLRTHHTTSHPTTHTTHTTNHTSSSYPWASDGSGHDTWGFTVRQCVSYVAWRLSRVGRPVWSRDGWGSASNWDNEARSHGFTVTSRPAVGSVAQWNAGESSTAYVAGSPRGTFRAGSYGHVAWVTQVYSDGSVQVAQYNGDGSRTYSTMRVKAPRYLRL